MDLVLAKKQNWEGSAYSGLLMAVLLLIAVVCSLCVKERLVRTEYDEMHTLMVNGTASSHEYKSFVSGKSGKSKSFQKSPSKFTVHSFMSNP